MATAATAVICPPEWVQGPGKGMSGLEMALRVILSSPPSEGTTAQAHFTVPRWKQTADGCPSPGVPVPS